ncbi:sensor histidine kinase [Halolamina salina]|uniref:histidine kinase n=1 Tax=Halolamina salina TaxID=1220023 RepID=A0ABD6B8R3_9EURY
MRNGTQTPAETTTGAVFGFDRGGRLRSWNGIATDVAGYDESAIDGLPFGDLFESDATSPTDLPAGPVELTLRTADGDARSVTFEVHRLGGEGPAVTLIGTDDERGDHRVRVLREMYEIVADRGRSFEQQVEALLALGRAELDVAYGTLSRIEGEEYLFEVVDADEGDDAIEAGDVVPLSATNCEVAASTEETIVLGDVARDAPEETDRAGYRDWGISCYIGAPVFVDDGVYGTFCFYDTTPRNGQFSDWEVTLVDLMCRWVSYELQRERANERLERQNDRLERFASIVSHDLRNPLNVADGSVELAREDGELEHLDRAAAALDRMDALIDDLLTLARAGEAIGETEAIDLAALCRECWGDLSTVDADLVDATERTIRADRTRVRQLLENLFRNAMEHGRPGGESVTVTVGDLEDGFYVADDGVGIPEADREIVFERGYSTNAEGTGYGLDIVAEIVEAHGWDVTLTESDGGGARFEITGVEFA